MNIYLSIRHKAFLTSMQVGEKQRLELEFIKYASLKSMASQLKRKRLGEWKCYSDDTYAYIRRIS